MRAWTSGSGSARAGLRAMGCDEHPRKITSAVELEHGHPHVSHSLLTLVQPFPTKFEES